MENKIKMKLSDNQIAFLSNLPEQGMGYQIVDVILKSGKILKKKMVFNSTFLQIEKGELTKPNEIAKIELHTKEDL
ncbi:MAG TPA: hypothetical protein PK228_18935 [Saprospiraceae bacterium]|nr:hypothetical protein [Saprospiraceae bacterium]